MVAASSGTICAVQREADSSTYGRPTNGFRAENDTLGRRPSGAHVAPSVGPKGRLGARESSVGMLDRADW